MGNLSNWRRALCLVAVGLCSRAPAEPLPTDLVESLRGCSGLAAREERLACFDRITAGLQPSAAPAAPPAATNPQARFGFSAERLQRAAATRDPAKIRLDEFRARVARAERMGNGGWRLVLDNGQVWSQVSPAEVIEPEPGSEVVIKPASFGSFLLVDARRHSARMHRLQ